ncbi:MAG: hypothetical protein ICV83_06905 [Cytophagales bacterium]|nr:hypothetical protein [Cytophagales bacterium]
MIQPSPVTPSRKFSLLGQVFLWVAGVGVAVVLALSAAVGLFLGPYLKQKLERGVREASDGLYVLKMDELKVQFWRGRLIAGGVVLQQDSAVYERLLHSGGEANYARVRLEVPVVTLGNIRWREYLGNDLVRVGEIFVDYPALRVQRNGRLPPRRKPASARDSEADSLVKPFFDRLPDLVHRVAAGGLVIDTLAIHGGKLHYEAVAREGVARHTADSLSVSCRDIRIDSSSRAEAWRRTLYAAQVRFGLRNYRYRAADGEYGLTIARIRCPDPYSLLVDSLDLRTLITDDAFARRHPYARDRFAVFVPRLAARELDIERFLRDDYVAELIQLTNPVVNVYRYTGRPRDPKPRRMPNEAVRQFAYYFRVDTLACRQATIQYSEQKAGADEPGDMLLENTNLQLLNLTNDPELMSAKTPAVVTGNCRLMGQGTLELTLAMNLLGESFDCRYSGTLARMQASGFNRFFMPSENIRIESGMVEKAVFAVHVRDGVATGNLKALYHDLKLAVFHKEKKKKRKFLSFLGNLLIKSNNQPTKDNPPKIGEISYRREADDGFVRLLWRAVKTGLITTLTPEALAKRALAGKGEEQQQEEKN